MTTYPHGKSALAAAESAKQQHGPDDVGIVAFSASGEPVAPFPSQLIYSSASLAWQGVALEKRHVSPYSAPMMAAPAHLLCITLVPTQPLSTTWRIGGRTVRGQVDPGRAFLYAAGEDFACATTASGPGLLLSIDAPSIAWACDLLKVKGAQMLRSHLPLAGWDEQNHGLAELMLRLDECVQGLNGNGSLYEETLLLALTLKLVMLYRADGRGDAGQLPRAGALPPRKLEAVRDYVWANLSRPMTLEDIARAAHLSAHHLCRQFRNALPVSLWQYVLRCRAEFARRLIARHPDMPLSGVASASGFESYSAFFNAFRKVHGAPPSGRKA